MVRGLVNEGKGAGDKIGEKGRSFSSNIAVGWLVRMGSMRKGEGKRGEKRK